MENQSENRINTLKELFTRHTGEPPDKFEKIKGSGSNRHYYRLFGKDQTVIGVLGDELLENEAFLYLSGHFLEKGLPVPEVFIISDDRHSYLQEDLGQQPLFDLVQQDHDGPVSDRIRDLYRKTLQQLIRFQLDGANGLDFTKCYPRHAFDRQSMQWDLNYFKYYFLKPTGVVFNEQRLETDFRLLMDYLLEAPAVYFMYRDFQARNIMIRDEEPWFIDYQGGRKGPLQYDLASLLFQARADLPHNFRKEMLEFYVGELDQRIELNRDTFIPHYYGFVLLRILQVLGAYGYRGYFEQKPHFIESTSFALNNLKWLTDHIQLPINLPELAHCFGQMTHTTMPPKDEGLTVEIHSFSYKKSGIPKDRSGNGGGFVFDCRALPNPGRYPEYKTVTGRDRPVIEFLEKEEAVAQFLVHVFAITDQAVNNYLERGFNNLSISFGCTGGQHRSVYCAEQLFNHLKDNFPVKLKLDHKMQQ